MTEIDKDKIVAAIAALIVESDIDPNDREACNLRLIKAGFHWTSIHHYMDDARAEARRRIEEKQRGN